MHHKYAYTHILHEATHQTKETKLALDICPSSVIFTKQKAISSKHSSDAQMFSLSKHLTYLLRKI